MMISMNELFDSIAGREVSRTELDHLVGEIQKGIRIFDEFETFFATAPPSQARNDVLQRFAEIRAPFGLRLRLLEAL
jgi:hypothetical protein